MKKIFIFLIICFALNSYSQTISPNQSAITLANNLLGGGVTITNPTLTCAGVANGLFTGFSSTNLNFNNGVLLSTGNAVDAVGGFNYGASTDLLQPGIPAMGSSTYDGCYLGFQITPKCNNLNIRYRFASEEYESYVGSSFNDAFGFFISGPNPGGGNYTNINMATVPGLPATGVSINTINNGNANAGPCVNCAYFVDNFGGTTLSASGLTSILTASANVTPCATYTLFMALVDRSDGLLDSQVFLEQSGIYCTTPVINVSGAASPICAGQSATLTASGVSTYTWSDGSTNPTLVVSPAATTSYTISGSNIGTCIQDSKVVTVIVDNPPTANAGSGSVLNCSNTSVTLNGTGGGNYSWSGPGILSGANTANPSVNQPGTYNLTVSLSTAPFCSSAVSSVNITQDIVSPVVTSNVSGILNCTLTSVNVVATTTSSPVSFSWSGAGITSGGTSASASVNQFGTYNYTVTNTNNGCTSSGSQVVTQNIANPVVTSSASGVLNCTLTSVNVDATTSTNPVNYNWSGTGITSSTNISTITVNQGGTFNYTVTDPANGCFASGSQFVSQDIATPLVTSSASSVLNCTLTSVNVDATTATNPVNYNWSGTGITSATNVSTITVNQGGTFNYTVTNPSNGCFIAGSQLVSQDITAPVVSPSVSGPLTCTNITVDVVASSSAAPITYNWSGTGIIAGSSTGTVTVNQTGNFNYTVTNTSNGCNTIGSLTVIQNTTVPVVTMPPTQTITCSAPFVTLIASASPSNCNPVWSGGVTSGASSYTAVASSSGFYTLTVTDPANGCFNSGVTQVVPSAGFPVVTTSSTNSITCNTATAQVVATTTTSPVSYSWSGSGITSGAATSTANVNAGGQYTVVVQNTISMCSSTITVDVALNNASPSVSLTTSATNNATITCIKPMATVTPTVDPIGSPYTYTWSASTGTITNQATATFTAAGVYSLSVTNTLTGCVSTTTNSTNTFTVDIDQGLPTATISATSTNSVIGCLPTNSIVTLGSSVVSTNSTSLTWLPNAVSTSTLNATTAGIYTLVVIDAVNGCSVTPQYTVGGGTTPPQNIDAGTSASIGCGNSTDTLNGTANSTNVNYSWNGPSGTSIFSGGNTANPIVTEIGTYTLTVTDNLTGCQNTDTIKVIQSNVIALFTADQLSGISPLTVNFTNASIGANSYNWTFGDTNSSQSQNPSNTFISGTYTVTLIASFGTCSDTATTVIVSEDGLTLEIPNVFTPNSDGANDIFIIKSTGIKEISLQIFNRWGQKMYEFSGPKASWDGSATQGTKVPEGTYFFFVIAKGFDGKEIEKNGTLNLFR